MVVGGWCCCCGVGGGGLLLADSLYDGDVGEEVVVLGGGHRLTEGLAVLEVAHQDAQAVQVRVLRRDDLEDGLAAGGRTPRVNPSAGHNQDLLSLSAFHVHSSSGGIAGLFHSKLFCTNIGTI